MSVSSLREPRPSQPAPGRGSVRRFRCEANSGTPVRAGTRRQKEKRKSAETFFDQSFLVSFFKLAISARSPPMSLWPPCSSLLIQTNQFRPGIAEAKGRVCSKRKVMLLHQEV